MYTVIHTHTTQHVYMYCYSPVYVNAGIVQIGNKTHSRMHVDHLRFGAANRRGRFLPARGRCVSCYSSAPVTDDGSKVMKGVSQVCYACYVCRVLLCRECFHNVYDHSTRGVPAEYVTLR